MENIVERKDKHWNGELNKIVFPSTLKDRISSGLGCEKDSVLILVRKGKRNIDRNSEFKKFRIIFFTDWCFRYKIKKNILNNVFIFVTSYSSGWINFKVTQRFIIYFKL